MTIESFNESVNAEIRRMTNKAKSMDEYDPLLAAYNNGNGDQQGESDNERNETGADLPIEYLREYDGAAEHYAKQGALPHCMGSPGALDYINADPEAFEQRVRDFKYAHAMEATHALTFDKAKAYWDKRRALQESLFPSRSVQQGEPTSFSAWLEANQDSIEPLDRTEATCQFYDERQNDFEQKP